MSAKKKKLQKAEQKRSKSIGKGGKAGKRARAGVEITNALLDELVQEAKLVRENAYAPYSKYKVGAAIVTKSGSLYTGCNVENSTFGATICAERGAIMQMVAHGDTDPVACAVVTKDGGSPCGICRQVLSEFAKDMPVVLVGIDSLDDEKGEGGKVVNLSDLLPLAFRLKR